MNEQVFQKTLRQLLDAGLEYSEAETKAREHAEAEFWQQVDRARETARDKAA